MPILSALLVLEKFSLGFFEKKICFECVSSEDFRVVIMFKSRKKSKKDLVCIIKGITFAPALREKRGILVTE